MGKNAPSVSSELNLAGTRKRLKKIEARVANPDQRVIEPGRLPTQPLHRDSGSEHQNGEVNRAGRKPGQFRLDAGGNAEFALLGEGNGESPGRDQGNSGEMKDRKDADELSGEGGITRKAQ